MRSNLPTPPKDTGMFLRNLVAKLTTIFTKIRPASGWQDMTASLNSARVAGSKPPTWTVMIGGIYAWLFAAAAENEVWISFHLPHDMALAYPEEDGTVGAPKLFPHVHWTPDGTDTGTARFGFEWTYAKGYALDAYGTTQTIYVEQAADGTAMKHYISETTDANALQSADFETDGLMLLRVFRDATHANDTLTDDVFINFVDFHYWSDGYLTVERNRGTGNIPWTKQAIM